MADYRDIEAAIDAIFDKLWIDCPERDWEFERNGTLNEVNDIVYALPSADVKPVVRCKDCKHRDPENKHCDSGGLERAGNIFPVSDDYFCAYGELRGKDSGSE